MSLFVPLLEITYSRPETTLSNSDSVSSFDASPGKDRKYKPFEYASRAGRRGAGSCEVGATERP